MDTINICVCTYQRPEHLALCLQSLDQQICPQDAQISIMVVDNDVSLSSKSTTLNFAKNSKYPTRYFCESKQGIPLARNRAITESLSLDTDYIAFIDDDERAMPEWIKCLYVYLKTHLKNTAVHGCVIPIFPDGTPQHLIQVFSSRKQKITGTRKNACATDNVIFPTSFIKKTGLRFDESSPLAGGTDTIFFTQATEKGLSIYECAEAIVHEHVFANRLSMNWMLKRKYRSGITDGWKKAHAGKSKLSMVLSNTLKLFLHTFLVCIACLTFNKVMRNKQLLKIAKATGIIAGHIGLKVNSYAEIDA